jgi:hypothetical protein
MPNEASPTPPPLRGNSRAYLVDRFKRAGLTQLAAAVEAGRLSAKTAAVELGWRKRPISSGASPNAAKKRAWLLRGLRRAGLFSATPHGEGGSTPVEVAAELQELQLGPSPHLGSRFRTREELRAAWEAGREELLKRAQPGRRPQAFYEFEFEGVRPPYDLERSTLWRLGALSEAERTALETEWRDEFNRCMAPDFAIARAWPDDLLTGNAARAEHLAWADVPHELRQRWRRRARRKSAA